MMIRGVAGSSNRRGDVEENTSRTSDRPTMIYCNPNAGYYEYLFLEVSELHLSLEQLSPPQSDLIEYYTRHNVNLVLWNYRGFGRSEGSPSPQNTFRDAECLVDYLREELGVKRIGVHGQSIGGMVATFVASSKSLDFLLADRTFSELSSIPEFMFGAKVKTIFRILTNWDFPMSKEYLNARCYKVINLGYPPCLPSPLPQVIGFDVKDTIIPYIGCLKNGVSKDFAISSS